LISLKRYGFENLHKQKRPWLKTIAFLDEKQKKAMGGRGAAHGL
jgi:hypothetical protein